MTEFLPFFLILIASVFFSELSRRLHLPWVIALLFAGIIIGPHSLGLVDTNETITFLGQIGLVFLMFMAGLESRVPNKDGSHVHTTVLALTNSIIPFIVGISITIWLGYEWITAILVGITFISSSVAVIIPTLASTQILTTSIGRLIVPAIVMQDILSLVLLSLLFHAVDPVTTLPLPVFYVLLFFLLLIMRWSVPRIEWMFSRWYNHDADTFQQEFRVVLTLLIGTVIVFEFVGLHPIIAGFFAGLILSDTIRTQEFKNKLTAISYGVFIPMFFIVTGIRTDISVLLEVRSVLFIISVIVIGSVVAKFASGWLGARFIGKKSIESAFIGSATIPQLSTTLAVVTSGVELAILPPVLATALIILSIVTTIVSPFLLRFFHNIWAITFADSGS